MIAISVIIPLAPDETKWGALLGDLDNMPDNTEVILVSSDLGRQENSNISNKNVVWLTAKSGRASQMNAGAAAAKNEYLWFLHADSRFAENTLPSLLAAIKKHPDDLLYFDLAFLQDATFLVRLNELGANFRSRVLNTPFGDQGFCINKELFCKAGGFIEGLAYGEDHVFTWKMRQLGVKVRPVQAKLYSSARKYKKYGWLQTTLKHQYLWLKQAWLQWRAI